MFFYHLLPLLVTQSVNWIHVRGAASWVDAKDQPDSQRDKEGQANRPQCDSWFKCQNGWWQQAGVDQENEVSHGLKNRFAH